MNIELRHLRYFVAVADEASFTAAAQPRACRAAGSQHADPAAGRRCRNPAAEPDEQGRHAHASGRRVPHALRGRRWPAWTAAWRPRGTPPVRSPASCRSGLGSGCENETRTRLLTAFERAYPEVEVRLQAFDMTQPSAGLLDHSSDVALLRPPVAAPGIELVVVRSEPRVFVLPAGHPLAAREELTAGRRRRAAVRHRRAGHRRLRADGLAGCLAHQAPARAATCRSSAPPRGPSTSGASTLRPGTASACARLPRRGSTAVLVSALSRARGCRLPRCA